MMLEVPLRIEFNKFAIKSAKKVVNGINLLYFPEADLLMEPDDIGEATKLPETLST